MKKVISYLVLLFCTISFVANAGHGLNGQGHGLGGQGHDRKATSRNIEMLSDTSQRVNVYSKSVATTQYKDSAFYANVVKKHGWFVGVGKKLTPKEASHLSCCYKFSQKNKAGNWTKMEAINGYGLPTTNHNIGSYLLNQYDDNDLSANQDWKEKLQTVCKWEFIADPSGKEVIQERALDQDDIIIYIYNPVKVGENEYTGSYTDGWGMPIFLRTDSLGNHAGYANFVHITRDEDGYEVLFAYTDIWGFPQKNKDGAYMTRKAYNKDGRQTLEASLNIVGDNMIDDFGNCGWEHYYYPTYNESYYYDAEWQRIKMPKTGRSDNDHVYGYRMFPDQYGRDTLIMYIDQFGNPDINENGIHAVRTQYNEHGFWTYKGWYDINGHLYADESGIAQIYYKFNSDGYHIEIGYQDAEGKYVNGPSGWCLEKDSYDTNGYCLYEVDYVADNDGVFTKQFEYTRDNQKNKKTRTWYEKNKQRVDSFDVQGRNIFLAWYDLDGNPIENDGLHKDVTIYDDEHNIETEIWLDKNEEETIYGDDDRSYSKAITIVDSTRHITSYYQYCYDYPYCAWQKQFDQSHNTTLAQWDITTYGEHARVGWWNVLHYKCEVDYTMYGSYRTMVGKNEFDEPSYMVALYSKKVYYFSDKDNGTRRYYDENGILIPSDSMETFKANLPKAFCIEVTDTSIAYPLGLRNGDIILSYGDWTTSENLRTNIDYFYLEAILKANEAKQITLLRHHPDTKSSEIIHYDLPKGRTSDLGFYPHKIYYTQKEKSRLQNTCSNYNITLSANEMPQSDTTLLMAVQIKGDFESAYLYHFPKYDIKDPGVIVYATETWKKGTDTWNMKESIEKWYDQDMFRINDAELYFTQDMLTTRHIIKTNSGLGGMTFIPIKVSMDLYNRVLQCYKSQFLDEDLISVPNIDAKQLYGKWLWMGEIADNNVNASYETTLNLNRNGSATIHDHVMMSIETNEGAILHVTCTLQSSLVWTLKNNTILFDAQDVKRSVIIESINITGSDEETKIAWMQKLQSNEAEFKEGVLAKLSFDEIINNNQLNIINISKKQFMTKEMNDIPFFRIK